MSLAVLKRKTFTHNSRHAPISGHSGGSTFGFSLNGTTRVNHMGRETNLAPGAMTGPSQIINNEPLGIYGHSSSVCTNDPTVVKTTVMNTKGMLEKKLRGIKRIPPMAPEREQNGCSMGRIITPAHDYVPCNRVDGKTCVGPLTQNFVKKHPISNGDQGHYIEQIVKINGKKSDLATNCILEYSNKSYNGIIGVVKASGFNVIKNYYKGCYTSGILPQNILKRLDKFNSIVPFTTNCNKNICNQFKSQSGIEFRQTKTISKSGNFSKPGVLTVDYSTYISKRLMRKNMVNHPVHGPLPDPSIRFTHHLDAKYNYITNLKHQNITPDNNEDYKDEYTNRIEEYREEIENNSQINKDVVSDIMDTGEESD